MANFTPLVGNQLGEKIEKIDSWPKSDVEDIRKEKTEPEIEFS